MNKQSVIENKIVKHQALTFDDVLLLPNYTDFRRQDVDLTCRLHAQVVLKLPVISSPMDTVTEEEMAAALALSGGLGIIHRNLSVSSQAAQVKKVKAHPAVSNGSAALDGKGRLLVGAAVGVGTGTDLEERVTALIDAQADVIVVDTAHGNTKFVTAAVAFIKSTHPRQVVMAGNIATYDGGKALIKAGADILRVGMGPGSICTTRVVTGMGVPQISAVSAVVRATDGTDVTVVADGGIRQTGDIAKALAFGAEAVMLGSLLAGKDESPGDKVEVKGKMYKQYRGMGSIAAMKKGGAERYGQSSKTHEKKLVAEGVEGLVEYTGSVADYLEQISGSLRSSFYYLGARNISEMFEKSRVIKISTAGLLESHPHSISLVNK